MAVLSKIRKNSVLLVGAIGVGLAAFVIGDIFQSGGFDSTSRYIGSVNGEDILAQDFLAKVSNMERNGQQTGMQVSNSIWEQEVKAHILGEEFEKIGIKIGKDQLLNIIKNEPSFTQNPQFLNAAGIFDINKFNEFLATMRKTNPEQWQGWLAYENQLEQFAKEQMYNSLIKSAVYTTKFDAEVANKAEATNVDFDYVTLQYTTIPDEQALISDADVAAYIKKNPNLFKAEPSREFEYVFIENKPSDKDIEEVKTEMQDLLNGKVVYNEETGANETQDSFRTVANVAEFVNANSEVPYDSSFVSKSDLPLEFQQEIADIAIGEVYGPYDYNGYSVLTRKLAAKKGATAKVSHILIGHTEAKSPAGAPTRTKEEAKAKADELLAEIRKNPASFAMLAMQNTDDPGSKQTGGVYDNVQKGQMVPEFDKFLFNNPVGATGVVETDFGYHVIKVDDLYDGMQLASIARKVQPSSATQDELFRTANLVLSEATEGAKLEDVSKKYKLAVTPVTVRHNDEMIAGLGANREIVQWSFQKGTAVETVKKFDTTAGQVIVKLINKNDDKLMSVSEAKQFVEPIIRNEKKATILKAKLVGSSLEEMAQKAQASVQTAENLTLANPNIPGLGREPKVIGKALGLEAGKVSEVVEGNNGVYVVKTKTVNQATPLADAKTKVTQLNQQVRGAASARAYSSLKNAAKIEDNRYIFR
nr:peptidylprolyl isomerase [uncultured Flavobacterium sp.]